MFFSFILFFNLLTDDLLIKGNLGLSYYYINLISQFLISILFSSFLTFFIYKYFKFSTFDVKNSSTSFIGTFFGILVAGCPACSLTVASYIGLASLVSFLPFFGLELKLISIIMLIYANYSTINSLNTCQLGSRIDEKKRWRNWE